MSIENTLNNYRKLLRVEQWYKNILVFAPLLFARDFMQLWPVLLLVFFGFSAVSSLTYIANDWLDREKDKLHPVKKHRPLVSGKISGRAALLTSAVLLIFVIFTFTEIDGLYPYAVITYFVLTTAYSLGLKNLPFLDLLIIGGNFTFRALAGFIWPPNFYHFTFFVFLFGFIMLFLTHKRRSDIKLLGVEKAIEHKPVLRYYTRTVCYSIRAFAYLLILASFYRLFREGWAPIFLFTLIAIIFYTSTLFIKKPKLVLRPHYLLKNKAWDFLLLLTIFIAAFN